MRNHSNIHATKSRDIQVNIYRTLPQEYIHFFGVCKFRQQNLMVHKQEICTKESNQVLVFFIRKGKVMSEINDV